MKSSNTSKKLKDNPTSLDAPRSNPDKDNTIVVLTVLHFISSAFGSKLAMLDCKLPYFVELNVFCPSKCTMGETEIDDARQALGVDDSRFARTVFDSLQFCREFLRLR